jgi:ubiquinol-cytochrome c reductase cytochrome b subunit
VLAGSAGVVPWADNVLQGPYRPGMVGNNAQPEWYLFWLEGALRIFPALEFSVLGMTISGPFFAGALLPGLVIGVLVAYPFVERKVYGLEGDWHVLQNPLEIPLRAAFVLGTLSFLLILSAAATNDILSRFLGLRVEAITWFFRVTAVVVPPLLAAGIWRYSTRRLARRALRVLTSEAAGA